MRHSTIAVRLVVILALILTALTPAIQPLYAQDATPIELDEAGFGVAQMDALAAGAQAEFTLELVEGDRVAMDLQGESDALVVAAFRMPYGDLVLGGAPEAFNYQTWAPEDGVYTIVVENTGDAAAGFVLRVVVSPAPLPTNKILTLDADGQTIPVAVGAAFQVALDARGDVDFPWRLDAYDTSVVSEAGGSAMVLLGTMPGAMRQEIFTFVGMAPGATTLTFANLSAGEGATDSFSVVIEVIEAGEEPAPEMLTLDAEGVAQTEGVLDPQGMATYMLAIEAGASVQAAILPGDAGFVLTVVGADGNPLQTDHVGASSFDQIVLVSQEYTFTVINFGEETHAYQFGVVVTPGVGEITAAGAADDDLALGEQLVMQLFNALRDGDTEAVKALLSPAFQIVRATGERFDASDYLDNLAVFAAYEVSDLKVTRDGDILVVTYAVRTSPTMDKGKLGPPAPRLTVFQQRNGAWKLLAHANFAAPVTAAEMPTMPESQITITEADNGGAVQVAAGGLVEVELPGNPTTGYIWQVTANDESILLPLSYEFAPDSDAIGAGGVERFSFQVMAPGVVELEFANSRPWEIDVEPAQTFAVSVEAMNAWSGDDATITVGMEENGQTVAILPGSVLLIALEGAPDGEWILAQSDPMIVQPLGDWWDYPGESDPEQARFHRYFLGVAGGTAELRFEFVNADDSIAEQGYTLTVEVLPLEPGYSGAALATEMDGGGEFALVTGDTLVVRLGANPTTGYDWRVVGTDDALLPAAGDPVYAPGADLAGAGGVYTFRFLAKAAGEAAVQIAEFAPGADEPDRTLDFNVAIVDPAPLTGNTVELSSADSGKAVNLAAGDWLKIVLEENASTGYRWVVTANDGAVLRFASGSDATVKAENENAVAGAGGKRIFLLRAVQSGVVDLEIGLFPPGSDEAAEIFAVKAAVE
jgi:inhibitor of cysteine peptidase